MIEFNHQRISPAPGTIQLHQHQHEYEQWWNKTEAAGELASKAKEAWKNAKDGTKKAEALEKKYRKLQDEYTAIHNSGEPLRKTQRLVWLEDSFLIPKDSANAIAAKAKFDEENGARSRDSGRQAWNAVKALAETCLKDSFGVTEQEKLSSLAGSVTSSIMGYAGSKSLLEQCEIDLRYYNRKAAERANRDKVEALTLEEGRQAFYLRALTNAEYSPDRQAELVAQATLEAAKIEERKETLTALLLSALATGPKSNEELMAEAGKSYDEATGSNYIPYSFEETAAVFKGLVKEGKVEVVKKKARLKEAA